MPDNRRLGSHPEETIKKKQKKGNSKIDFVTAWEIDRSGTIGESTRSKSQALDFSFIVLIVYPEGIVSSNTVIARDK